MTERFTWLPAFFDLLKMENVLLQREDDAQLAPAQLFNVDVEDWGQVANQAAKYGLRWCAVWAEDGTEAMQVTACLEMQGDYLAMRTQLARAALLLPSHTPYYPAADRPERHLQDMFGIVYTDHPDARRWTRHSAWEDKDHPLRKEFPVAGYPAEVTPPNSDYKFLEAQGAGVYEIPVGPVHAGIIEPGHFRFQAVGETVLHLEEHLGYVHKGIEKIAEGRDPIGLARLAGRVSGDTTVAHTWAACMAMERAARISVPPLALHLRALLAERERVVNHLWDIAMVCNDVAFAFGFYQFSRLRENWLRTHSALFGHRLMMDCIIPGGVSDAIAIGAAECATLKTENAKLLAELDEMLPIFADNASLEDRLVGTGVLDVAIAKRFGAVGYVGRASGQDYDVRRDAGYAPYDRLAVTAPVYQDGDVAMRVQVRHDEIRASINLLNEILDSLPSGPLNTDWQAAPVGSEGMGVVDGWRGEIISYVRFGADGRIARFFPRDPSWLTWPTLEQLIHNNIVPDFPVCNKSVNGSYSGHDL